jgi:hypothetical protein
LGGRDWEDQGSRPAHAKIGSTNKIWAQWCTPVILFTQKAQEDHVLRPAPGKNARPYLKITETKKEVGDGGGLEVWLKW